MPYYVRAINRENWPEPEENEKVFDLHADVLNDLHTSNNMMSVWYAENEEEIPEAELAYLASMDKWVKEEEIEFIVIDKETVDEKGIEVIPSLNFTYVSSYAEKHRDFYNLTFGSIETIAEIVMISINKRMDRIVTQTEIRDLFANAVKRGLINSSIISKEKHGALRKYLKKIEEEIATQ